MMRITFLEFQDNLKRYIELANTQDIVVTHSDGLSFRVVPLEERKVKYNADFVENILQVNEEAEKGYVVKINDTNDIWKDIL